MLRSRSSSITHVSLLPPPCEEFTTSDPALSATRVRAAGNDFHLLAIKNVRTQIDVAAFASRLRKKTGARESGTIGCAM